MKQRGARSAQLAAVVRRFEHWRRTRPAAAGREARIPDELWAAAVAVAREEGVHRVSRAVRVEYLKLKRRSEQVTTAECTAVVPSFVALDAGGVIASKRAASGDEVVGGVGRVVIEFCARQGERMRVELEGARGVDMAGLVHAFWSRAS